MKRFLLLLLTLAALALPALARSNAGNAINLTGGYVQTPHAADLNTYPLTVTAWIKTTSTAAPNAGIVNKYIDGSVNGYSVHVSGGNVYAFYFRDVNNRVFPGGSGRWRMARGTTSLKIGRAHV